MCAKETFGKPDTADNVALDFSKRAYLTELMDEPCEYEDLRSCLRDLEQVNRFTFGYKPTLDWLNRQLPHLPRHRTIHVVDVGCGGGDMLRKVAAWADAKKLAVKLTGVDLNPYATRTAQEFTDTNLPIQWVTGDVYSFEPEIPIDIVISSLFTHHLDDEEIVQFLMWMETTAQLSWFVNDLSRGPKAYAMFQLLAGCFRWHRFVRHDGPVSIRRSFSVDDWSSYARQAGLSDDMPFIQAHWPGRLCVSRSRLK
jgi:2-polyprenyl-3-methyl-5-hydroxy-6-metoxy-1,4-benzoquinol methylase